MSAEEVVRQARDAKNAGAHSYCLVATWRGPSDKDFDKVCNIIREVKNNFTVKHKNEQQEKLKAKA